jgi:putative DNA-invertase from lambdoid prophage Rac
MTAVAQFERDILIERTQSGLQRAWAKGKKSGRKPALTELQRAAVLAAIESGASIASLARQYDISRQTIMRARLDKGAAQAA